MRAVWTLCVGVAGKWKFNGFSTSALFRWVSFYYFSDERRSLMWFFTHRFTAKLSDFVFHTIWKKVSLFSSTASQQQYHRDPIVIVEYQIWVCVEFQVQFYESKAWQFASLSDAAAGEEWKFSIFHRSILRNQSDMSSSSLLLFYFHSNTFSPVCLLPFALFVLAARNNNRHLNFPHILRFCLVFGGEIQWAQMRVNVNEHGGGSGKLLKT